MRNAKSPELIGWTAICAFLGVSRTKANQLALQEEDPLPIQRFGGRIQANRAAVAEWKERQTAAWTPQTT